MALTQVSSAGIKDAEVKTADILDANITTAKVADDAITAAKIADDAITSALISDEAVDEARLQISNEGSNWQYLQKESGNTGGLTWAAVPAGVGGATGVDFDDGVKVRFGTHDDLEIYHTGGENFIRGSASASRLYIDSCEEIQLRHLDTDGSNIENMIKAKGDGAVELYYDGSLQTKTTSTGLHLADDKRIDFGTGSDLKIYHDASDSKIENELLIIQHVENIYKNIRFFKIKMIKYKKTEF